jgi:UDP-N-acetylmuramoyl-tripeptide--D-alanyl-D-alanine ligase
VIETLLAWPTLVALALAAVAAVPIAARWLRVAQREHYVAGSVMRMAWLWVTRTQATRAGLVVAVLLIGLSVLLGARLAGTSLAVGPGVVAAVLPALLAIVVLAGLPRGLSVRGTSKPLAFTGRLTRLLTCWIVLVLAAGILLAGLAGAAGPALVLLLSAPLTDLALAIMAPIEKAASQRFVVQAQKRLKQSGARVVAITGSYGKTSTKNYVAHLLSAAFTTVASPASFNNRLGLSRAVNDKLVPGTEVFVAEMGMAAPGQIAELCRQFPPAIAAITVVGEAHLQRMRTPEAIFAEKASITEFAPIVVIPVDDARLAALAEQCRASGKTVVTTSCRPDGAADVTLVPAAEGATDAEIWHLRLAPGADPVPVRISGTGHAVNVAVAAGIAVAAGVPAAAIATRVGDLPGSQHRAEVQQAPTGALVVDDTYNANPVGSLRALEGAASLAAERGGPLVVVTPGMVELGSVQAERNRAFGAAIGAANGLLFAVARTNRDALLAGYASTATSEAPGAIAVATREQAVRRAVEAAGDRGVILYENDLPDHYP